MHVSFASGATDGFYEASGSSDSDSSGFSDSDDGRVLSDERDDVVGFVDFVVVVMTLDSVAVDDEFPPPLKAEMIHHNNAMTTTTMTTAAILRRR